MIYAQKASSMNGLSITGLVGISMYLLNFLNDSAKGNNK
jgi:hypothetical protein